MLHSHSIGEQPNVIMKDPMSNIAARVYVGKMYINMLLLSARVG